MAGTWERVARGCNQRQSAQFPDSVRADTPCDISGCSFSRIDCVNALIVKRVRRAGDASLVDRPSGGGAADTGRYL